MENDLFTSQTAFPDLWNALREIYDPEIPVNIVELGLIYDITMSPEGFVNIKMTLTSPNCPVAESLPGQVQQKILLLETFQEKPILGVDVQLVWDPPWSKEKMSEAAQFELGFL